MHKYLKVNFKKPSQQVYHHDNFGMDSINMRETNSKPFNRKELSPQTGRFS